MGDLKTELAVPAAPPLDPVANGLVLQVENADGSSAFDATVPPGAYDAATRRGWTVNTAGTTFTFRGATARAKIAAVKSRPGNVAVSVKLVGQAIGTPTTPIGLRLLLAPSSDTRCGEKRFATSGTCTVKGGGATIVCK